MAQVIPYEDTPLGAIYLSFLFDPEFRTQVDENARAAFSEKGLEVPPEIDLRVHVNTEDTFWLAFPSDPNAELSDESLVTVSGGGKTASTAGTVGCAASVPSCASSFGTAGSSGTAG